MSDYPNSYTSAPELFEAKDFAETVLTNDVLLLPSSIQVLSTIQFPDSGVITIASDFGKSTSPNEEDWACSFSYTSKTDDSFLGLILVKGNFIPKESGERVALNVISDHHNTLAEEILSLQSLLGHRSTTDPVAIIHRVATLTDKVRVPRAFFVPSVKSGFASLRVTFTDMSTRHPEKWIWSFGDGESSFSQHPTHTYTEPGVYSVKLSVFNDYGSDEFEATSIIRVMDIPPEEPQLEANPRKILVGELSSVIVTPRSSDRSDRFSRWDWVLPEDLERISSPGGIITQGLPEGFYRTAVPALNIGFSKGGLFDISVIGRTQLGGYVGVREESLIESVETTNLWDLRYADGTGKVYEMGLISKAFKDKGVSSIELDPEILNSYDRYLLSSNNPFSGIFVRMNSVGQMKFHEYDGFVDIWSAMSSASVEWLPHFLSFVHNNDLFLMFGEESENQISNQVAKFNLISRSGWVNQEVTGGTLFSSNHEVYTSSVWEGTHSTVYILRRPQYSIFDSFVQFAPETLTMIAATPPSDAPGTGSGSGGVDLRTKSGQLVSLRDGIYLFGPIGAVSKYSPSTDVWLIDSNSPKIFETNVRISAAGRSDTAFVENHGSRYLSYFDIDTSTFISLEAANNLALEKEVY